MMRIGLSGRARWTDRTFLEFLGEETRQPAEAIDRFWRVVVVVTSDLHEVGRRSRCRSSRKASLRHARRWDSPACRWVSTIRSSSTSSARWHLQSGTSALGIAYDGHRVTDVVITEVSRGRQ